MNITGIINEIENLNTATERCIAYAEVIIYLKTVRKAYYFIECDTDWKNEINKKLIDDLHKSIDDKILEVKHLIEITIEHK